jgi:nitroreductase
MKMPADLSPYVPVARPIGVRSCAEALHRAVSAARYAPSAYNAQPWRWLVSDEGLDLFLEPGRTIRAGDPDHRLAMIGCGAALQHARLALAAQGWRTTVIRGPDGADPDHLARLHIDAVARIGRRAAHAAQNIRLRHTDPRPVTGDPLGTDDLAPLHAAVEAEGARLHMLRPDEILRLIMASEPAPGITPDEAQWYDELARWAGRDRIVGSGRDTGLRRHAGAQDRAAAFAVLYGPGDMRLDWLRAGEALSAAWLAATAMQASVLPFSAPIERPAARESLVRTVGHLGHPYLVVRLGRHPGPRVAPHSPRLPLDQIMQVRKA